MFSMSLVSVAVCEVHLLFSPLRYNKLFLSRQPEGSSDKTAAQLVAGSSYFLSMRPLG